MLRQLLALAIFAMAALLVAPPARSDPPPWAPAHGARAEHRYIYYPRHQVYYAPERSLWFWLDAGQWQFGVQLPVIYQQYTYGGIAIELDVAQPYERHAEVVQRYGKAEHAQYRPMAEKRPQGRGGKGHPRGKPP